MILSHLSNKHNSMSHLLCNNTIYTCVASHIQILAPSSIQQSIALCSCRFGSSHTTAPWCQLAVQPQTTSAASSRRRQPRRTYGEFRVVGRPAQLFNHHILLLLFPVVAERGDGRRWTQDPAGPGEDPSAEGDPAGAAHRPCRSLEPLVPFVSVGRIM